MPSVWDHTVCSISIRWNFMNLRRKPHFQHPFSSKKSSSGQKIIASYWSTAYYMGNQSQFLHCVHERKACNTSSIILPSFSAIILRVLKSVLWMLRDEKKKDSVLFWIPSYKQVIRLHTFSVSLTKHDSRVWFL